jgi:hypothetical protein
VPDIHLALYNDVILFDNASKLAYVTSWVHLDEHEDVEAAYAAGASHWRRPVVVTPWTAANLYESGMSLHAMPIDAAAKGQQEMP